MTKLALARKNPFAVAFGKSLQLERNRMARKSDEVASKIGIGEGFYRLIESGNENLHVSKTASLIRAFDGRFSFDAVSMILASLAMMEAEGNSMRADPADFKGYFAGLTKAVEEISSLDNGLQRLLLPFVQVAAFDPSKGHTSVEWDKLTGQMTQYLLAPKDFELPSFRRQEQEFAQLYDQMPSLYYEMFWSTITQLPKTLVTASLWEWESKNFHRFTELHAFVKDPRWIATEKNLRRYPYPYLWTSNFQKAWILYSCADASSKQLKIDFRRILGNIPQKNSHVDKSVIDEKLEFVFCDSDETINAIFSDDLRPFQAIWIFSLGKINVGYAANVDPSGEMPYCQNLSSKSTNEVLKTIAVFMDQQV